MPGSFNKGGSGVPRTRNPASIPRASAFKPLGGPQFYDVSLTESVTAVDSLSATLDAVGSLTEPVTSSESISATFTAIGLLTDAATASESEVSSLVAVGVLSEPVTSSESEISALVAVGSLTDSASASESEASTFITNTTITEIVTAGESETGGIVAVGSLTESVTASDTQTAALGTTDISIPAGSGGAVWMGGPVIRNAQPARHVLVTGHVRAAGVNAEDNSSATSVLNASVVDQVSAADSSDADLILTPWPPGPRLLETIKFEGAMLHLYDDMSISLDVEAGATVDVTVSKGKVDGVFEIPLMDILNDT